jgi:DNA-binding beta-propeller fold protein YncE
MKRCNPKRVMMPILLIGFLYLPICLQANNLFQGWAPGPLGMAISHDGKKAYITFSLDDSLLVVDLTTFTITDSIDVSSAGTMLNSGAAFLTLDDKKLYVANYSAKNIMVINTVSRRVEKILPLKPTYFAAICSSRDGSKIYFSSEDGTLSIVDTRDDSIQKIFVPGVIFGQVIPSAYNPYILYSVGRLIVSSGVFQSTFFEFNMTTNSITRSSYLPDSVIPSILIARRLYLNPNETRAYFGWSDGSRDKGSGNFIAFDLAAFQLLSSTPIDNGVVDFAVNEITSKIYMLGFWSGGSSPNTVPIHEWDMTQNRVIREIPLSPSSDQRAILMDPSDPTALYMTDGDNNVLRRIDIPSGHVLKTVNFNRADILPRGICRQENIGYVLSKSSDVAYKLDLLSGNFTGAIHLSSSPMAWGIYNEKLYIKVQGSNIIQAIDTQDNSIAGTYDIGTSMNSIFLNFFGDKMAAVDLGSKMIGQRLLIFDAKSMQLLKSIDLPQEPLGDKVIVSPDNSKLYLTHGLMMGDTTIKIIDTSSYEIIKRIIVPAAPQRNGHTGFNEGVFDEAHRILYLTGFESVYKIGMDSNNLIGTLDMLDAYSSHGLQGWTPTGLCGISLSSQKDKLFITSGDAHTLYTYDLNNSLWSSKFINLRGYFPTQAICSTDNRYFFSINQRSDSITMVDLNSVELKKIIDLHAFSIILDAHGQKMLNRSLSQGEYINILNWSTDPKDTHVVKHRIYEQNGSTKNLIAEVDSNTYQYKHRRVDKNKTYSYVIVAVDDQGQEGIPATVIIK